MQPDPASVAGKQPPIGESTDLLIIGAGPAGMAAALAAAGSGVRVTLVDENPIPKQTMGEEVPLHFGGRMAATLANRNAVSDRILEANPQLAEAMDAGVDVRVGTVAWGLFPQHRTAAWLGSFVVGLAEEGRAYLMRVGQVIVAAGRRDMGLAFEGWQLPGVMGATAAYRLATLYDALESKEAVLVGSDAEALQIGNALLDAGVRIAAIVEQAEAVVGPEYLLSRLVSRGARVFTGYVVRRASGGQQGVTSVELAAVGGGAGETVSCDTVLLAVGAIPALELLESSGCAVSFQPERGGHAPTVDRWQRTSVPFVLAAGDCAGIWPTKSLSDAVARREGRIAAAAALRVLGVDSEEEPAVQPDPRVSDMPARRLAWVRASVLESPAQPFVCQCEEVTAQEILGLRPPRYLGWDGAVGREAGRSPDVIKRLTRAGMGPCQGRRCREQIAALVALDSNTPLGAVPLASYRTPVRPLSLRQLASVAEAPATNEHWDSWFGMRSQWVPFWRIGVDEPEGCGQNRRERFWTANAGPEGKAQGRRLAQNRRERFWTANAGPKGEAQGRRLAMTAGGAEVIIVGAGVTGLSAAWWLARDGVDTLVLEAGQLGWAASGRNGGGCSHHHSPLFKEEQRLWPLMDELLGYPTEFRPGRIRIALNERQFQLYRRALENGAEQGFRSDVLDSRQVRELVPLADESAYGGYFYHFGGHANPHRTAQAYAWALRDHGGRVMQRTPVLGFTTHADRVISVRTVGGTFACEHVVIAAGPNTGALAAQLGVSIPLMSARAEMIVTEPLPLMPLGGVDGNGLYGRQTLRGNLAYGGGPHEWVDLPDLQQTRSHSTPLQASIARRLAELLPKAAHARVIRSWAGFIENTPDGRPVIDRPATIANLTVATLSSVGFGLSPASGRAIRDLVLTGACSFADLRTCRLDRFAALETDWRAQQGWLPVGLLPAG